MEESLWPKFEEKAPEDDILPVTGFPDYQQGLLRKQVMFPGHLT